MNHKIIDLGIPDSIYIRKTLGQLKDEKTFREAAEKFWYEYELMKEGNRNPVYVQGHRRRLDNYLTPFFGDMGLSEVTAGSVQDYRIHRHKTSRTGRPPARNTTGETILEIAVRGKRGVGYCKSTTGAVKPFLRLKERNKPKASDKLFPKFPRELFNAILEEEDLKLDREGNRRTAYSLRHTYICLRLMEGADIYQIAKNCRTSVEMIEKYYAAHIATTLDASAINKKKKRKTKAKRREFEDEY